MTDSKGQFIKRVCPSFSRFEILSKPGALAPDEDLLQEVIAKVENRKTPIVLAWFGTCEITRKEGKYIKIRKPYAQNIGICINESQYFQDQILKANPKAKVILLECPYYSINKVYKQEQRR